MARVTVEDCLDKVENQYDLVLLAKERTHELNTGSEPLVPIENDKRTVIALREIAEQKVSVEELQEKGINKLRKYPDTTGEQEEIDLPEEDNFEKNYKGESSKSGAAILPSKRSRKIPEPEKLISKELNENIKEEELEKNLTEK